MKLFVFFVFLFIVLINNAVNAFTLIQNSDGILCDGFRCPENSANCVISQKTRPDLSKIDYVRKCLDIRGNVLDIFEKTMNNPHPGSSVNNYVSSGGYSSIITSQNRFGGGADDNYNEEEVRRYQEEAKKQVDLALNNAAQQADYWREWSKNLNEKIQKDVAQGLRW